MGKEKWAEKNLTGQPKMSVSVALENSGIIEIKTPLATVEEAYWVNVSIPKAKANVTNATTEDGAEKKADNETTEEGAEKKTDSEEAKTRRTLRRTNQETQRPQTEPMGLMRPPSRWRPSK